jgi:hypothetical protein
MAATKIEPKYRDPVITLSKFFDDGIVLPSCLAKGG